jgi:hypothetical protein
MVAPQKNHFSILMISKKVTGTMASIDGASGGRPFPGERRSPLLFTRPSIFKGFGTENQVFFQSLSQSGLNPPKFCRVHFFDRFLKIPV